MITENSFLNYGIEDPEDKENIEMNKQDIKVIKQYNKTNDLNENLKMEISSEENEESLSEKINNLNITSNPISQSKNNPFTFTKENLNEKYFELESRKNLLKYGEKIYSFNKMLAVKNSIPEYFLSKHKLSENARMKMVDWMIEVLSCYNCSNETFFLSVSIMDQFLFKTNSILKNQNIHLIGIASMYIANKFEEIYPIPLKHFVVKIGHNKFKDIIIKSQTMRILEVISFENLIISSVYDFIKIYFFDFYSNNKLNLICTDSFIIYQKIQETAIYFGKISVHYVKFYNLNDKEKAICSICCAIQLFFEKNPFCLNLGKKKFYNDWEIFILNNNHINHFNQKKNDLYNAYFDYHNNNYISHNLDKFCPLSYI